MTDKEDKIEINFLDHVAIRVLDMEVSAAWYEKVLGLKRYAIAEWGDFPIFLLAGKTGIALFPADSAAVKRSKESKHVQIDHFAFNVTKENFDKAIRRYTELNLVFNIQDHHYFDSIYTEDPDGHTVELTTLKVQEHDFYK